MAQTLFNGIVKDVENQQPIANVEIFNTTNHQNSTSDKNGNFILNATEKDNYIILIAEGYEVLEQNLSSIEEDSKKEFFLQKQSIELDAVVVRNREELLFRLRRLADVEGTEIYAGKKNEVVKLEQVIANKATNNARQIYAQVVGLNIYEDCSGGVQLNVGGRGLDPNRSANFNIRQNSYDISADVLGYPESYYTPPAELINEIQVIRGAASLQYGSQFGGLINFKLKQSSPRKAEFLTRQSIASFNTFTTYNELSGTLNKFSYLASVNYKNGSCFRPNSDYESFNSFAKASYKFSEKTSLGLEFTHLNSLSEQPGGLTDVQFYADATFSNRERNYFQVKWNLLSARLDHEFSPTSKISWLVNGLHAKRDALGFRTNRVSQIDDIEQPRDLIKGEFQNISSELRFIKDYQIASKNVTTLIGTKVYSARNKALQGAGDNGVEGNFSYQNEKFPNYPYQSNFEFPNENMALFSESIFRINDQFSITPGIRFENIKTQSSGSYKQIFTNLAGDVIAENEFLDNREFKRNFTLLGLGLSYKTKSATEFYANFSQNYRSVTFNDIRINNPTYQIDPDIQDEKGYTSDFGFRGNIMNKFSFDIGGFGLSYDQRIGEILKPETRMNPEGVEEETGRVIRYRSNIGEAFIYGIESFAEWNLTNTFPIDNDKVYASVFVNSAFTSSEYVRSQENNVKGNRVEFIPEINLKTGLRFGYENLLGNFQFTHIGEQFTDATNAPQDFNDSQRGIEGSIPAYQVADLSLSYKWRNYKLETGANNLFNESYFTRRATGYPGPGIIPSDQRNYYLTIQAIF